MFSLPKLNYSYNDLEPIIDAKTMEIHHTKHHQTYVDNLNNLLVKNNLQEKYTHLIQEKGEEEALKDILKNLSSFSQESQQAIRNNAGGHLNHTFFWKILKKDIVISDSLKKIIIDSFGSYDSFVEQFMQSALSRFGSGWAWLISDTQKKLKIISTPNQDNPIMEGYNPILGIDVWEHAYYLKHQNRRADWVKAFFSVINWQKVEDFYK